MKIEQILKFADTRKTDVKIVDLFLIISELFGYQCELSDFIWTEKLFEYYSTEEITFALDIAILRQDKFETLTDFLKYTFGILKRQREKSLGISESEENKYDSYIKNLKS